MRSCRTLLIYCISFVACFTAGIAVDLACGPETDPYDYYVSFFHNNLQGKGEYRPFYFTNYSFVYDETEPASEADINAGEWAAYLGRDVNVKDVATAMYRLDDHTDNYLENRYFKNDDKLPDSLKNNTFLKALQLKRNANALKYYRFAKSVEAIASVGADKWDPKPLDSLALHTAGGTAWKNALAEKDRFIQLRYYYQAQRLLHYGFNYREALSIYNKYIDAFATQSHVKGWAMALKAGEQRRMKDTIQAAYLFSKVFAQYPERRLQAYQNYKYIHVKPAQVLPFTTSNTEKAVIYAIDGFGNPELSIEALEKVYQYDPASPMVGVLLVREVNKLEEVYLTNNLQQASTANYGNYVDKDAAKKQLDRLRYLHQVIGFCRMLVNQQKYPEYNIGNLAAAYLAWMEGDNANGFALLRAMNSEKLSPAMEDQKQIIQLLLSSQNIQRLNEINENQLLPALKWLDGKAKAEVRKVKLNDFAFRDDHKFTNTARDFYQHILAPAYLRQGDTTKAALAILKSGGDPTMDFWENNLHSIQILRLIRWKKTPPPLAYSIFMAERLASVKPNYLNELLGTAYLREHQYAKAIATLKLVDPVVLNKYPEDYYKGDPFIDKINDYPKILRYGKTKGYNKLQFAVAMNDLEQKIKTDEKNAPAHYYRYATGLYNTSHYGNAWYLISYSWSAMDFGRKAIYAYDTDYVKTQNAEKYYLLARSLSTNDEFKAKCTIMAAKCRQKQAIAPDYSMLNYSELEKTYLRQLHKSEYFDELRDNYKKTAIYKKAIGECSYLKDFIMLNK